MQALRVGTPPRGMGRSSLEISHTGGRESELPRVRFHLTDVELEKMLIFFFFFLSTGDREQSGLLCNQRLCPADNTRGINCPCPAQALEEGADAASQRLGLSPRQLSVWPSNGWGSPEPGPGLSLASQRATKGESLASCQGLHITEY